MSHGRLKLVAAAAVAAGAAGLALAQGQPAVLDPARPVVVELFTSQSCYSCPPAEAYLGTLADRPGVIALEWHVDYWNDIHYGDAGQWIDPFSDAAHTERQRGYNRAIRGTGNVYTPQMVIDGRLEAVGSRSGDVEAALREAAAGPASAAIAVARAGEGGLEAAIDGTAAGSAGVWLVRFLTEETTQVPRGENHGKTLVNHHVVTETVRLGEWQGGRAVFALPPPPPGAGCAILVQPDREGPILAAAACPMPAG